MARTQGQSYRRLVWAQFKRDRLALCALAGIAFVLAVALYAPCLAHSKPYFMRIGGEVSSPLLREIFAPSEAPEFLLERILNFLMVYLTLGAPILGAAYVLLTPFKVLRRPALLYLALLLFEVCLVPFFVVRQKLDTTDYRAIAAKAKADGDLVLMPPIPYNPFEQFTSYRKPDYTHLMGTDKVGRDVLARVIHGARVSLSVGFLSVGVAVLIGVFAGALSAYHGGWVDLILQRVVEIVMTFPVFLLVLTIMAFLEKRSIFNIMLVIGLTGWTGIARLVRGQMLAQKRLDYVVAAQALGFSSWRIMFRHLLPNSIAPVLVSVTFGIAGAILTESGLSFLGFGVSPPTASWGELLNQALAWPTGFWWLTTFPGFLIFASVTVYNLVGEGLRDALDPRLRT